MAIELQASHLHTRRVPREARLYRVALRQMGVASVLFGVVLLAWWFWGVPGRRGGAVFVNSVGMEMIWVEAGVLEVYPLTLRRGEFPRLEVKHGYYFAATEVTLGQWVEVMNVRESLGPKRKEWPAPVDDWRMVMDFCARLTEQDRALGKLPQGYIYTLPTEVQWEYACRAGTIGDYAGPMEQVAWYATNSGGEAHPVATREPNAWGFYDMHGNLEEWYAEGEGGQNLHYEVAFNPEYPSVVTALSRRGGFWNSRMEHCRSGFQDAAWTFFRAPADGGLGFRPVAIPEEGLPR